MNKEDSLQELMAAWQQHSDRIGQIAERHDLSHIKLVPRLFVLSSRRRQALSSLAMALVSLAAIVGMVVFRRHYISDIFDQLFFAFLALLLLVALIHSLRQIYYIYKSTGLAHSSPKLGREMPVAFRAEPCVKEGQRSVSLNSQFSTLSRAAVFASVVVMFLFLAVPVQNGRAMSYGTPSHRSAALASVAFTLSHIQ